MIRMKLKKYISSVFFSGMLAAELAVLLDVLLVFNGTALSVAKFAVLLMGVFFAQAVVPGFRLRHRKIAVAVIAAVVGVPLLVAALCWAFVSRSVVYQSVDNGKMEAYGGQKVMLLVPHQDDDINVLGGVMEEYVKYGSEVTVVFSTNGDYYGLADVRLREAVDALGGIGIPEDHLIFLGYGDQWDKAGPHIYNAQPGTVVQSVAGYTQTYGTSGHGAYREGREYTVDNFLSDIENVILDYRPDVLYCVDYDYNIDHRALSHSFEKVMGKILKEYPDYRPQVFKGYAYNTAWESEKDFYGENLVSAKNIFAEPYLQQPAVYRWEDRVRLPVSADGLSRSVISAGQHEMLSVYASQGGNMYGARVINSDKVFWQRGTGSLSYQARIETSSGAAELLNDFMILESVDLLDSDHAPYDGTWIPEPSDSEKQILVEFPEPVELKQIVLYDHPDSEKNVLDAVITFDDGTVVRTGPLDPSGAATRISVSTKAVSSFTVSLSRMQGTAGLTELEAYGREMDPQPVFLKLMDEDENFVYDYWIDPSGIQMFRLYSGGTEVDVESCIVICSNSCCKAEIQDDGIRVECPVGESCIVTVTSADGSLEDCVYIQNPGRLERAWKMFWLRAEESVMNLCDTKRLHERIFVCRLWTKLFARLC